MTEIWNTIEDTPSEIGAKEFRLRASHVIKALAQVDQSWADNAAQRLKGSEIDDGRDWVHPLDRTMLHVYELWLLEHDGVRQSRHPGAWISADGLMNLGGDTQESLEEAQAIADQEHRLVRLWMRHPGAVPGAFRLFAPSE